MAELTCPKCHGSMRQYERSGVHVDQCSDCRGIFLDRGELERLVDAETSWARTEMRAPDPRPAPPPSYSHDQYHAKPYKKRRSFLEELFD